MSLSPLETNIEPTKFDIYCVVPNITCLPLRSAVLVAFALLVIVLAERLPAHACSLTESCGEMWVALQDVGKETAFFDRAGRSINTSEVQIGDSLTANREINVRAHPADWTKSTFTLKAGQTVVVAELKTLPISGARKQAWIRIQAAPDQMGAVDRSTTNTRNELRKRMDLWLSNDQAFRCQVVKPPFPSKNDYSPSVNNLTCDDGDTAFFDGLLCSAGEPTGCSTVKRSQSLSAGSDYGRWWRAPTKIGTPEGQGGQTSLSTDLALGILAYIAETRDRDGFRNWVNWIHRNPRCANCVPPGALRYCESDLCALKPIDCLLLNRLANVLDEPMVCSPLDLLPTVPLPSNFDQQFQKLQADLQAALDKYSPSLPIPPLPDFHSLYKGAAQLYANAFQALSNLVRNVSSGSLFPEQASAVMADINSVINDNPHLAAVEVFLLEKKFGYDSGLLVDAAKNILATNPKNPFFIYVAKGRSDPDFAQQILQKCPSTKTDNPRLQWAWERAEREMAWTETMFWDCVFIADLYLTEIPNLPKEPFSRTTDPVVGRAIHDAQAAAKVIQGTFNQMQALIDTLGKLPPPDPVACAADPSSCATKLKNCLDNPGSCLPPAPTPPTKPSDAPGPVGDYCKHNWCPGN